MLDIDGKVAEKKNGRITGRMISFKRGDVGKVVSERGTSRRDKAYLISLVDGTVLLKGNVVLFPEHDDISILSEALHLANPDFQIRDEDRDEGAQY